MSALLDHLGNRPDLNAAPRYAAILGERPSQGARSPLLWNAVFEATGLEVRFHPFDVSDAALPQVIEALRADQRFVGGSVTMPHKRAVLELLDGVEPLAERIGAVNAIYRDGDRLVGANTDGAGALGSVLEKLGCASLGDRKVVQIGAGGAGAAVAAYLADSLEDGRLVLANRDRPAADALAVRIGGPVRTIAFPPAPQDLADADVVVNCTSLGFAAPGDEGTRRPEKAMTPLGPVDAVADNIRHSVAALESAKPDALVFDVVYQPLRTPLLILADALGRRLLNGLPMNREQAVIAFCKALPDGPEAATVRRIMAEVA